MTLWEARVDDAIRRTEATGVSPIRAIPLDMIATAIQLRARAQDISVIRDDVVDRLLLDVMRDNDIPRPAVLREGR